jgi:hypothetical protein
VNIRDHGLSQKYTDLCSRTPKGYFINLSFGEPPRENIFGINDLSVTDQLKLVTSSVLQHDSKLLPLIIENISFT